VHYRKLPFKVNTYLLTVHIQIFVPIIQILRQLAWFDPIEVGASINRSKFTAVLKGFDLLNNWVQ